MITVPVSVDQNLVQELIGITRTEHSDLQIYGSLFRGDSVVLLDTFADEESISPVALEEKYFPLTLGLLGDKPLIVGYSYHNWYDSPPERKGETLTISNKPYLYSDNTPCIEVRWTLLIDESVEVYIQIEAFPQTSQEMNEHPERTIDTAVARSIHQYKLDLLGGFHQIFRRFERLEEVYGNTGIDRCWVNTTIEAYTATEINFRLYINRIANVHGGWNERTDEKLLIVKNGSNTKIEGTVPSSWEHLLNLNAANMSAVHRSIQQLSQRWDEPTNWIYQ